MKKRTRHEMGMEIQAVWHFLKLAHRIHPGYIPLAVMSALLGALAPFPGIILPGYILNELAGQKRGSQLLLYIGLLAGFNALTGFAGSIMSKKMQVSGEKLADGFELHAGRHIMQMDFEKLEDAKVLDMKEKALFNIRLRDALLGGPRTIVEIFRLTATLAGVVGMIALLNPALVAVLFLLVGGNALVYGRIQRTKTLFYQDIAVYNRQFGYFRDLTQDFRNAKDVRIYRMSEHITNRINEHHSSVNRVFQKMFLKQRRHDGFSAVIIQAQTLATYAFAAWGVYRDMIRIGDFTMYISAANQFSGAATQLMAKLVDFRMLGRVLQDYQMFSFSIRENLAFQETADEERIRTSLGQAGILEKVEELPLGLDTPLYKDFDKDGTELSGGEMQKLAIARTLYKNAPLVVLDEPTAALDPYAEYEVYSKFNEITNGKTSIYISHRLSSCRFCDAVAVFDNGALVEYGSHEQLVAQGRLYAEMWKAQAQYYQ